MAFQEILEGIFCKRIKEQSFEYQRIKNEHISKLEIQNHEKDNKLISLNQKYDEACLDVESLSQDIKELESQAKGLNPVDLYCIAKGYRINNFVYKDKIIINGVKISCNMREMITPNSFIVEKNRKSIQKTDKSISGGLFLWYQRVMNKVSHMIEWTTDGRDDNYYYPAYALTIGKADCDDYAFAQCSIEPELGTAFGFWDRGDGKPIGHAFAVGIIGGDLWIFDGVPNNSVKHERSGYSINYIITKNNIYVVDSGVVFGDILFG